MIEKYTNGIFISAPKASELTKLDRIKLIALGREWSKEFITIRIEKTNDLNAKGNKTYRLIKTREFAFDGLLIIRRYCNFDGHFLANNHPFENYYLNKHPEEEEFEFTFNRNGKIYFDDDQRSYEAEIRDNYMKLSYRYYGASGSYFLAKLMFVPSIK